MNERQLKNTPWRRFKANYSAMAGLIIIIIASFVAVFAYILAPDHSPNANRMIVEMGGRKPGSTQLFLKIPRQKDIKQETAIERLISGKEDPVQYIPIQSFSESADSINAVKYIDEDVFQPIRFSKADINYRNGESITETRRFLLGTDQYGRDILSRLIVGTRVSMAVGMITVCISVILGVLFGALAGYYRGRTDDIVMWFINVLWSIPTLLLVFAMTLLLGKGFWQVFIAIGFTMWVNVARMVRGQVMQIREMEYVLAARALGFTNLRILWNHVLPNVAGPLIVIAASNFASAIVIEAGLSFLGVGVQPPQPSWGLMIKENYNFIITNNPGLALAPGIAIMLLVLAFNLLGNGLRDALDVRSGI
ncbi:MAG TPA: ABC transporter permease [Flavitalea sp.]|nr:ABC transporter permease [Flavitalea sp.]